MTVHKLQPQPEGSGADARRERMRRRFRKLSRRASRAERRRSRSAGPGGVLAALVVASACIGAAVFKLAETLVTRAFWP